MLGQFTDPLLMFASISAALVAGVFLTFSDFAEAAAWTGKWAVAA